MGSREENGEGIELSIVVPYYNPGTRLAQHLGEIVETLKATGLSYEVLAVSDGSTDESPESFTDLVGEHLRRIDLPHHVGKGEALRVGLRQGRGRYVGFIDADGDIPARLLGPFVDAIRTGSVDIVVGSKRHPGSEVVYPPLRLLYSWSYQQFVRLLFHLEVRDTQTGIKILRREVLEKLLPETFEERFAFDLELLVLAREHGFDRVAELPVHVLKRLGSSISAPAVLGIVADTVGIWWRLRVRRRYR
ncbi:MAG TPA: glycosyltransferase [Acidimicrobiales bacterium]|nr:glycosyltransferase [Acidimicrobiales bacterium]